MLVPFCKTLVKVKQRDEIPKIVSLQSKQHDEIPKNVSLNIRNSTHFLATSDFERPLNSVFQSQYLCL